MQKIITVDLPLEATRPKILTEDEKIRRKKDLKILIAIAAVVFLIAIAGRILYDISVNSGFILGHLVPFPFGFAVAMYMFFKSPLISPKVKCRPYSEELKRLASLGYKIGSSGVIFEGEKMTRGFAVMKLEAEDTENGTEKNNKT
jgi:hypothetical protein